MTIKLNLIIFILFFIFIIQCIGIINGFNVISNSIIEKSTNVLGVEFDYALMDLEFDREIYRVRNIPCGNFDCKNKPINGSVDCSCDYTNPIQCPKPLDIESCPNTQCNIDYCDSNLFQWETIEANEPKNFESSNFKLLQIRYKANSSICEGIRMEGYQNQGRLHISVGKDPYGGFVRSTPNIAPDTFMQLSFCPSDNGFVYDGQPIDIWNQDTYFITVIPDSNYINFNLTIISKDIPPISDLPTNTCVGIETTHTCIVDGIPVTNTTDADGLFDYYTFEVTKPMVISFAAPTIFQDIDFFVSDDPNNKFPNYDNFPKWDCVNENDDFLILSLKPNDDGTPKILYIGVTPFYESVYSFTVTSLGYKEYVPISSGYPRGGAFSILGSSRILLPNNSYYKCNFWSTCTHYTILYPFNESFPVWPIPIQFAEDYRFNQITYYNSASRSKHYSSAFLLSTTEGDFTQLNKDFNDLLGVKIEFLSTLVDINGLPLDGIYSFIENKNLTCNYNQFQSILAEMDSQEGRLYNNSDFGTVNSIIFNIDTLTLSDSWKACSERASSYLQTNELKINKSLTICSYSPTDVQYDLDPCCNVTLSFFQCCVPKMVEVPLSEFIGVHDDLIADQCFSSACTASVLNEYYNSLSVVSECDVPARVSTNSALEMREALRECKSQLKTISCTSDSQCGNNILDGTQIKCDLRLRLCMVPPEQSDHQYIQCVFNRLPASYTYSFLNNYGIIEDDELFVSKIFDAISMDDCTYVYGTGYRKTYSYVTAYQVDYYSCYPTNNCFDSSCETVHDVCFDGQIGGWGFEQNSYLDQCGRLGFCPILTSSPNGDNCTESTDWCETMCNGITQFCGHCSTDQTDCFYFKNVTDEASCKSGSRDVCLYPNGNYVLDVTPEECVDEQFGECDVPCDRKCVGWGFTGCGVAGLDNLNYPHDLNETECAKLPGSSYSENLILCYFTGYNTSDKCLANNAGTKEYRYSWIDCESKANDECYDEIFYGMCNLEDIPCQTKQECENAGKCSDSYFFSPQNTPVYSEGMGKCVRGHFVYRSGFYTPTCETYEQNDSPMGCFDYAPRFTHKTCSSQAMADQGFKWWAPATNREECEAPMGCKILDNSPYNLPYNFRFNEMDEALCKGCGNDSFNSWEQKFSWTPGNWLVGIPEKTQWRQNSYVFSGTVKKVLDYQRLYEELDNSVNTHIADLYRSEVICRMERVEGNLRSIACSCSEGGEANANCFSSSSLLLGQSKPCANEESSYEFSYGRVVFNKNSVHMGCTSVLVSQVSQQLYKSTTPQTLSSNFVSYNKPNNYGILNGNGAIIGILLGDGVKINTQGVSSLMICLSYNGTSHSKDYNVYDFAITSTNITSLTPMEVSTIIIDQLLCANFTSFSEDTSFFPIVRLESYIGQNKEVFDKTAKGLIYTLAVIFLVTSIWGFFQIVMVLIKKYKGIIPEIKLVHSLILIVTIFITIRAIYFFIIPSGALANNSVGDYILVVLPTFIYFTSFTIIISLWYMIVNSKNSGRTLFARLKAIILIINAVLYLLFIVIVLVFNYTESNPSNDCGSRIVREVSSTTSQLVVSIVYAIIQALISLIIGSAFLYLGGSLFLAMRNVKPNLTNGNSGGGGSGGGGEKNQHQKKIFIVTFACSIGFIIHCVFVLILVGANPSNITFSFLGLIITEVIPSLSIFYCYNQGHFGGLKQSTDVNLVSYATPNREDFSSTNSNFNSRRGTESISKNYSSSHSLN